MAIAITLEYTPSLLSAISSSNDDKNIIEQNGVRKIIIDPNPNTNNHHSFVNNTEHNTNNRYIQQYYRSCGNGNNRCNTVIGKKVKILHVK